MAVKAPASLRRAGIEVPPCKHHLLLQDHFQYFAHRQVVATFRYTPIMVREIVLPTPRLVMEPDGLSLNDLREQLKCITVRGFDFLSLILERLCSIKQEVGGTKFEQPIADLLVQEKLDRDFFRDMIESCQIELCQHPDPMKRITIQVSSNPLAEFTINRLSFVGQPCEPADLYSRARFELERKIS